MFANQVALVTCETARVGFSDSIHGESQIGIFDQPRKGVNGVDRVDGQFICFAGKTDGNVPPIPIGFPSNNLLELQCGDTITCMILSFAAPELLQSTRVSVIGAGAPGGPTVSIRNGVSIATAMINWVTRINGTPTTASDFLLTFNATDDVGGSTVRDI